MLGFIIGTVCLIGLVRVLRHGRGFEGRWGHGGYGGYGHQGGRRFGGGARRWMLRRFFERLETTPGQEKAIVAALNELRDNRTVLKEEARQTREDLARVVAGGVVDESALEETFARHDRLVAQLRVSFVESLRKATEALDESQRAQVANLLQRASRFGASRIFI